MLKKCLPVKNKNVKIEKLKIGKNDVKKIKKTVYKIFLLKIPFFLNNINEIFNFCSPLIFEEPLFWHQETFFELKRRKENTYQ